MATVQLTGSKFFDTQTKVHTAAQNTYVSLALEFQKHLSNESHKHGIIDNGKDKKSSSKQKCTNREYHVKHNEDVKHKDVIMYCATNQFPEL